MAVGADNFIFAIATDWLWAALILLTTGHRRVKPPTLSNAEVKNYLRSSPLRHVFMVWCIINNMHNFAFTLKRSNMCIEV